MIRSTVHSGHRSCRHVNILQVFGTESVFCGVNSRSAGMQATGGSVVDAGGDARARRDLDRCRAAAIARNVDIIVS